MNRLAAALVSAAVLVGCAGRDAAPPAEAEDLPEGVAARIGDELIRVESVRAVARAQSVSLAEALRRLIVDALMAAQAREHFPRFQTVAVERAALSRALLEELEHQARAQVRPTAADVERMTAERWWELDRPASARTTHVVVLVKNPEQEPAARALADAIADAVRGRDEVRSFIERAYAVPRGNLEVKAERLPPVAPDGRVVPSNEPARGEPAGRFDLAFAEAAHAIATEGAHSPVVKSAFGYHVILLEQKLPERRLSADERRTLVTEHLVRERARELLERELERLRAATFIETHRAAETLTAQVPLGAAP